jgi:hypothetical protein
MKTLLPWATSAGTLLGMWLLAQKNSAGWIVGLANQVLWVAFAITFEAWGLLPLTIALIFVYTKGLLKWRREESVAIVN